MKISRQIVASLLLVSCLAIAGTPVSRIEKTQSVLLRAKASGWQTLLQLDRDRAEKWAADQGLELKKYLPSGTVIELMNLEQNRLIYNTTFNAGEAATIAADHVRSDGLAGLHLDGSQMILGMWDGDGVQTTHQEFGGRVIQKDQCAKNGNHSTHVAGTMVATGVVAAAKGMSPAATLYAHDWRYDAAEMALEAADGMLLSNHSYGHAAGWVYDVFGDKKWVWLGDVSLSPTDDYYFGLYTATTRLYDEIALNAPYYLIVKSAGNDRADDGPPPETEYWYYKNRYLFKSTDLRDLDGPWDCIPDDAVGKNVLTVGAIDDILDGRFSPAEIEVKMSSFSSWGPADDGRIKPDIVTNGMTVYSTLASGDDQYGSLDGTSMAAPGATGALALLQQHYHDTHNGQYMLSATLKALAIHSARESGAYDGPDYSAGWGLLDVESAAALITQDQQNPGFLRQLVLEQNQPDTLFVHSAGDQSFKVTICWTDPPGEPVHALNPSTPMLVNDLDLRVTKLPDDQTLFPWRLDRDNPAAPAVRADNSVDNVEQIYSAQPSPGIYRIVVSHKDSLQNGQQTYALIASGISMTEPSLSLTIHVVGNGSVNKNENKTAFMPGERVELFAQPMPGWSFAGWNGDLSGNTNPEWVVLDKSKSITASFQPIHMPVINTRLEYVGNTPDPIKPDEGILTLKVTAFSTDRLAHAIKIFQGSFFLDPVFCTQVLDVNFSEPFFPPSSYTQRMEHYGQPLDLATNGRIFYSYALSGSTLLHISEQPVAITQVHIRYQKSTLRGQISMQGPFSDFKVFDDADCDITGTEEPLPLAFQDIALPVEVKQFTAAIRGSTVLLSWSTLSESTNLGFHLYRAMKEAGPYLQINHQLIPGAGTSLSEHRYQWVDDRVEPGNSYFYKLVDIDFDGQQTWHDLVSITVASPSSIALEGNYPNPFNPSTRIVFTLPRKMKVTLSIYNLQGQLERSLVDASLNSGRHEFSWDGRDDLDLPVPAGIYFYTLSGEGFQNTKRMLLLK